MQSHHRSNYESIVKYDASSRITLEYNLQCDKAFPFGKGSLKRMVFLVKT